MTLIPAVRKFLRWLLRLLSRKAVRVFVLLIKFLHELHDGCRSRHVTESSHRRSSSVQRRAIIPSMDPSNRNNQVGHTGDISHKGQDDVLMPQEPRLTPDLGYGANPIPNETRASRDLRISVGGVAVPPAIGNVNGPHQATSVTYTESSIPMEMSPVEVAPLGKDSNMEFTPFGATEIDRYHRKVLMYVLLHVVRTYG